MSNFFNQEIKLNKAWALIFFFLFLFLLIVYKSKVYSDFDTPTYFYLFDLKNFAYSSYFKRPIVFPLYLRVIKTISTLVYYDVFSIINLFLRAGSIILYSFLLIKTSQEPFMPIVFIIFSLFNVQINQYINYMIPEIFITFLLGLHFYAVLRYMRDSSDLLNSIILVLSLLLLAFTKPIFLFLPVVLVLILRKKISKFLIVCLLMLYVLPVVLRSLIIFSKADVFSFSLISQINISGTVLDYGFSNYILDGQNAPQIKEIMSYSNSEVAFSLKEAMSGSRTRNFDIYDRIKIIMNNFSINEVSAIVALGRYSQQVVFSYPFEYIYKSLEKIPTIIQSINLNPKDFIYYVDFYNAGMIKQLYFSIYRFLWGLIKSCMSALYLFLVLIYTFLNSLRTEKSSNLLINYSFFLWLYCVSMISFAAYDSFVRLKSIVDDVLIFYLIGGSYHLVIGLREKINNITMDKSYNSYKKQNKINKENVKGG